MPEFTFELKAVADKYVQCSLMLAPDFRMRCGHPATYAVRMPPENDGGYMWRCRNHRDVVEQHYIYGDTTNVLGDYTAVIYQRREVDNHPEV